MKKILSAIVLLLVFANVAGASTHGEYEGKPIVKIVVDGKTITPTGTPAYADDGSVMVPISALRQLGFGVEWDSVTYSVKVTPPEPLSIKEPVKNTLPIGEESTTSTTETGTQTGTVNNETIPATTPAPTPAPAATPVPTPTSTPTPVPDNTAACQSIRDNYSGQIAMAGYTESTIGKERLKVLQLEYARDQALKNAGC